MVGGTRSTQSKKTDNSEDKGGKGGGRGGIQTTLDPKVIKKVNFTDEGKEKTKEEKTDKRRETREAEKREEEMRAFIEKITDEVRKIRLERVEMEKAKIAIEAAMVDMGERLERLENQMKERERKEREWEEAQTTRSAISLGSEATEGDRGSVWSLRSAWSGKSGASLSEREVVRMKKLVYDQDRKERKDNIVIRGVNPETNDLKAWVTAFLEDKLNVKAIVDFARKSGPIIVAKVRGEDKEVIMKNKHMLAGTTIFIENDLNLDDRRKQEEINRWIKLKKGEGWNVRQGTGRFWFKGIWYKWENREVVEKEMEREINARKRVGNSPVNTEKEEARKWDLR